ncbi:unnamed protein product [Adineta steineri]|uniref:Uncharacterized protein n=2 Tax=Adineta steineri TaxID=433720 RepID=A0A813UCR9_9BILA|nr:unnamed protein product [Adineta steineri]
MDSSNVAFVQEIMEQEQMKRDCVNAHIEDISEKFLRNDSWDALKPDEIAEVSLQVPAEIIDSFAGDAQTHRFRQFLSIATNFASLPYAQKLCKIPELVESIKQLLENMMREIREYSDMASELRDLIQCFVQMVTEVKHNVNMKLPLLAAAKSQIGIVQDVMSTDPSQELNDIDKKDIQLALNRMSTGMQGLLSLAKSARAESQKLNARIHTMTNSVQSKKLILEERLEVASFCFRYAMPFGTTSTGAAVGGLVAAESFGGIGALVISGTVFPPITAIICACILGGVATGTAILLVKRFWAQRQLKALGYLNKIFDSLCQLRSANRHFMSYMADTEEKANKLSQNIQDIQLCLESERQRRVNRDVCNIAIDSTTAMIESLERISNLDISEWSDTSRMINFSKSSIIRNAITN